MAEDPRALVRSAQAAELARDFAGAAGLLRRAAALCRTQGNEARAEQLERHAERLGQDGARATDPGTSTQASGSGTSTEAIALGTTTRASGSGTSTQATDLETSTPDSDLGTLTCGSGLPTATGGAGGRAHADRGPELASRSIEAWCSFCCLPSTEVGRLVTGPTGAFICTGCVEQARESLGTQPKPGAAVPRLQGSKSSPLLPAHREALVDIDRATASGARRLLILGAPSAAISRIPTALGEVGMRGPGPKPGKPVLLTEEALLAVGDSRTLRALMEGAFVLAVDGVLHARRSLAGPAPRPLPTTAELAEATGHRLPYALLESVEAVIPVRPTTEPELQAHARGLLLELDPPRTVSEPLLGELVSAAVEAVHPVQELEALIRRLPPGHSELLEEKA